MDKDLILQELVARDGAKFDLSKLCFPQQLAFIRDPSPFKTLVTPRRSGKTMGDAFALLDTATTCPKSVSLYITLSRINAKKIIWPALLEANRDNLLGGVPNESELSLKFPNGAIIYLTGAKDKKEIEKFRGLPIKRAIIDEAQSFPDFIKELIDEVLVPATFDTGGDIILSGTPKPVPSGYFHDAAHSSSWSHHGWQMADNPWIKAKTGHSAQQIIEKECKRKGVTLDDPTIQRECFARWVLDLNSLVFRYNPAINHYNEDWHLVQPPKFECVIGIDIGFDDADAIAVVGWTPASPKSFLVEEVIKNKQGITELAQQVDVLIKKYNPMRIVMDTGGLGKKIAEELRKRFSIPIVAAEKARKFEFIELLNDAMRTGNFNAKKDSRFANDAFLVEWDRRGDKPKIKDTFHSDICDAVLYAYREALHWLHTPTVEVPATGSPAWLAEQEAEMIRRLEEEQAGKKESEQPLDWSFLDSKRLLLFISSSFLLLCKYISLILVRKSPRSGTFGHFLPV